MMQNNQEQMSISGLNRNSLPFSSSSSSSSSSFNSPSFNSRRSSTPHIPFSATSIKNNEDENNTSQYQETWPSPPTQQNYLKALRNSNRRRYSITNTTNTNNNNNNNDESSSTIALHTNNTSSRNSGSRNAGYRPPPSSRHRSPRHSHKKITKSNSAIQSTNSNNNNNSINSHGKYDTNNNNISNNTSNGFNNFNNLNRSTSAVHSNSNSIFKSNLNDSNGESGWNFEGNIETSNMIWLGDPDKVFFQEKRCKSIGRNLQEFLKLSQETQTSSNNNSSIKLFDLDGAAVCLGGGGTHNLKIFTKTDPTTGICTEIRLSI